MPRRPPLTLLVTVGLVAGCTLALQVVLTRVFAPALFYHFGFLAISLALVGTGAAAILVYIKPRWFRPPGWASSLTGWAAALGVLLFVVPAVLVRLDYTFESSITMRFALTLGLASLLSAAPFFAAGMVITLAITRYTRWIHQVYAFDLVGAGVGALAIVPVLWLAPAPSVMPALGLMAAAGALLCAVSAKERRTGAGVAGLGVLATILAAATSVYHLPPPLDFPTVADRWSPLTRVVGYSNPGGPFGIVTYDRDYAPVPRYARGGPLPDWRDLRMGPQSVGFLLPPPGRVLVIGGGGGRDVYNALSSGARRVDVIELNRNIRRVVDEDLGPEWGSAYSLPRVSVRIGDGRSTLAQTETRYRTINISGTNTLSANAAQGYALTENNLYTVEAVDEYFDRLAPGGVLSLTRLLRFAGDEALRATILVLEALERRGIADPGRHVVVLLGRDNLTSARTGTVLARLSPYRPDELSEIRRLARERGDGVAYGPGGPFLGTWAQLARAPDLDAFCSSYRVNVCPPTDDKPFFFNFERLSDVGEPTPEGYLTSVKPFEVLLVALAILTVLCILAFLLPLAMVARARRPSPSSLTFFAAIGVGFLVLEVVMIQRFVLFLGFPTYSLSVVLASLLAFTGLGAALSSRLQDPRSGLTAALGIAILLIVAAAFALPALLHALIDLPFAVRILIAIVILAPFGLLLGMAMPIGLRRLSDLYPGGAAAWAWGINGVCSVLASVLAISVAITLGFTAATLVAAACYAVAAGHAAFGRWPRPETRDPSRDAPPAVAATSAAMPASTES